MSASTFIVGRSPKRPGGLPAASQRSRSHDRQFDTKFQAIL